MPDEDGAIGTIFQEADRHLLPGFQRRIVPVDGHGILALVGGSGPPLLMLHGDPQTHLCWHRVAPTLAERFTVVLPDLRGRGEGTLAPPTDDHSGYSKRAMAAEQLQVMRALGFDRFALVGHDRGARVARRLALDHPDAVNRLAVLDIVPALDFYEALDDALAQDYFYFNFLTQPYPVPERLIGGSAKEFMEVILFGLSKDKVSYDPMALAAYLASSTRPEAIAAMCECFRAGYFIDRVHDAEDRRRAKTIACPTLIGWGEKGVIGRHFDLETIWDRWCDSPTYAAFPSGHFIPEEAPEPLLSALRAFLSGEPYASGTN